MNEHPLREEARRVHSKILGCYDRHPFMCDDCEEIHAALVRVVRECADAAKSDRSRPHHAITERWGLKE